MKRLAVVLPIPVVACVILVAYPRTSFLALPRPVAAPEAQASRNPAEEDLPDLILLHGNVITVDARDSIAQAVAIRGTKIVRVGTDAEVQALAGAGTRTLDLKGRTVTPGLIDAHCHFQEVGELYDITLSDTAVRSVNDILDRVKAKVEQAKPGEWIRGAGWDEGKLLERRYVTSADLDTVAPHNPVWLEHTTGHYGVANSTALAAADINVATKDPPAGTIDRDARGNPTGVLKEAAQNLVTRLIPPYTHEQRKNGLLKIITDFHKEGMTAVKNPGITDDDWALYEELLQENRLNIRLFALWRSAPTMESAKALVARLGQLPKPPFAAGGMLMAGGIKIFMDGSGGGRTAWMYQDWNKGFSSTDSGNKGYPSIDPELYRQQVRMFHKAGLHVSTHAIGDRAIDWVLDTYSEVLAEMPTRKLRHGLIHGNVPTDHAIETIARLEKDYDSGYPELQPPFLWWLGDNYAGNLGANRVGRLIPLRTFERKGIRWAGGSDYPVTPFAARYGLWASTVRETLHGTYGKQPFGTAESVDIHTALRSYTIWAAHQLFLEDRVGSIEPGKEADLAVWDRDWYSVPTSELAQLHCQLTLVAGKVVFQATN